MFDSSDRITDRCNSKFVVINLYSLCHLRGNNNNQQQSESQTPGHRRRVTKQKQRTSLHDMPLHKTSFSFPENFCWENDSHNLRQTCWHLQIVSEKH